MAVNVPNQGIFVQQLTQAVISIRNDFQAIVNLNGYVTSMGGATFLTAAAPNGIGLGSSDASAIVATLGNLAALAAAYNGGSPAPQLNYSANSEPFWAGQ